MTVRTLSLLALPLLILTCLACSSDDSSDSPEALAIDLGVIQSLSGPAAVYGKTIRQGIDLAVEELNEQGEVTITYETADDRSDVDEGVAITRRFIEEGVTAIIGPTLSNVAFEAFPIAQDESVPVLGATTTAAGISEIGDYIFRVALTEAVVVPAALRYVHDETGFSRAVLIFDSNDAFSRSSADAMRAGVAAAGAQINLEIDVAKEDGEARIAALVLDEAEAVLVTPLVEAAAKIVKTIREKGFDGPIVGGNSFNTLDIATLAGDAIEGAYVGAAWNPGLTSEAGQRFTEAYRERFGEAPDQFAAQGYTAVYVLADAVKRAASTDNEAVRDALAETRDLKTPLGSLTMSEDRDAVHDPVVQQYRNGQLVVVD